MKTPEILFLCTGNSCRSILAEVTFNALAGPAMHASSAGSHPTGYVHPRALALLQREGFSTEGLYSKSWDDLKKTPDIVITVCASAAGETCPAYLGSAIRAHWGVEDPAKATGNEAEIEAAFNTVNQMRIIGRWMRMITIPNQSSVPKAFLELDEEGRMKPSAYYDRVVDVMEELMKFTWLTRGCSDYLTDRYSERLESAEALSARVNQRSLCTPEQESK